MNILNLLLFSYMSIMLSFMTNYTHLLLSLLYLECMTLIIILYIPLTMSMNNSSFHQLSLCILTLSTCEASLGLSMIVNMSRTHGSDLLSSNSINSC